MDREDVIRMANEAGMDFETDRLKDALVRFAALVAAAERERIVEACKKGVETGEFESPYVYDGVQRCLSVISALT